MENIKPEDFNSSGKFVNPKMESMELPNETEPEAIEEEDNNDANSDNNINYDNSKYAFQQVIDKQYPQEYYQLQNDYQEILKEKELIMKSLNEEMLLNQQQKNQIEILKKKLNDSMKNKTKLTKNDKDNNYADMVLSISNLSKEKGEYKEKIEQLSQQIEEISKQKNESEEQNSSLHQHLTSVQGDVDKLNETIKQLTKEADDYKITIKDLTEKNEELQKNCKDKKEIEDNLKELMIEKEKIEKDNLTLNKAKENLYKDIQNKVNEIEELKKKVATNAKAAPELFEALSLKDEQVKELANTNKELEGIVSQYKEIIEKLNGQNKELLKEKEDITQCLSNTKSSNEQSLKEALDKIQSHEEEIRNLSNENLKLKSDIEHYKLNLNEIKAKFSETNIQQKKFISDIEKTKKDYDSIYNELLVSKGQLSTKDQIYNDQIEKLKKQLDQMQVDITNERESMKNELKSKEDIISNLQYQIDNPQSSPNYTLYQPRLAVQSCLTAAKVLLENAHKFYSEEYFNNFLDCVDYLRRELTICYQALNQDDHFEVLFNNLTVKYQKLCKEYNYIREENQRIDAYSDKVNYENSIYKDVNEFNNELTSRILKYYINDFGLKNVLGALWSNGLKMIYKTYDLKEINRRIKEYKEIISKYKAENDKNSYFNVSLEMKELSKLEKEKISYEKQIEEIGRIKWECENKLGILEKNTFDNNSQMNIEGKGN